MYLLFTSDTSYQKTHDTSIELFGDSKHELSEIQEASGRIGGRARVSALGFQSYRRRNMQNNFDKTSNAENVSPRLPSAAPHHTPIGGCIELLNDIRAEGLRIMVLGGDEGTLVSGWALGFMPRVSRQPGRLKLNSPPVREIPASSAMIPSDSTGPRR